jgi:hypothetical protein
VPSGRDRHILHELGISEQVDYRYPQLNTMYSKSTSTLCSRYNYIRYEDRAKHDGPSYELTTVTSERQPNKLLSIDCSVEAQRTRYSSQN